MGDDRTLRQKLEAMANQTASPAEAEVARAMLANLPETRVGIETRRVLTRAEIMAAPTRTQAIRRAVSVRFPSGRWVDMYEDEVNWQLVETHRLHYRWEGSPDIIIPTASARPPKLYP